MDAPYQSLEDIEAAFLAAQGIETGALFAQGDILCAACTPPNLARWQMKEGDVLAKVGSRVKRGRSTLYARLRVSRIFPEDLVIPELFPHGVRDVPADIHWSHYELCSRTWSEDAPDTPYRWLNRAVTEGLSVRRLKLEMIANDGLPPETDDDPAFYPHYLLDAAPCHVDTWDGRWLTVYVEEPPANILTIPPGTRVIITALVEPEARPGPAEPVQTSGRKEAVA